MRSAGKSSPTSEASSNVADFKSYPLGGPVGGGMGVTAVQTAFTLDQTTDAMEWIFPADEAVALTRLGFRYGVRTGTPPTYKASLQGVDAAGNPDGTIKGGGSPAAVTFTPPASAAWDGTFQSVTLANSYTPANPGEMLAMVIAYDSGTVDASNKSSFSNRCDGGVYGLPYAIENNAGTRARAGGLPIFAYGSATKWYGHPLQNVTVTPLFNSGSTPDEYAAKFTLPTTFVATYTLKGIRLMGQSPVAAGSMKVNLYDATTVIATATLDQDYFQSSGGTREMTFLFQDVTRPTLTAGNTYRIGFQPQGAQNIGVNRMQVANAAEWDAWPGGQDWAVSTRTDAGAWTDVLTDRIICDLLIANWALSPPGPVLNPSLEGL